MNIEEFKEIWRNTEVHADAGAADLMRGMGKGNMKTSLEKLADYYRRFAILSGIMLVNPWIFTMMSRDGIMRFTWALPILWFSLFAVSMTIDITLWHRIKAIDVCDMSVTEVAARARRCRKLHLLSEVVMAPLAVAFLIVMGFAADDVYMLAGMIAGGILGLIVGLNIMFRILRLYRAVINDGNDIIEDAGE